MDTMGQKFRAARERKRITVSRAAALTRIKVQHIEMMEQDDFSKMPAPTYAKGFIRIYADLLGLDPAPLVQEYVDQHLSAPAPVQKPAPRSREAEARPVAPRERAPQPPKAPREPWKMPALPFADALRGIGPQMVAYLPRIVVGGVLVLILVLIGRCAARTVSTADDPGAPATRMDPQAIMSEPPMHYLELPVVEEAP